MIAVLDIGKTNVKLAITTEAGVVVETRAAPNLCRPGPPWVHHDLAATEAWLLGALAELGARHAITAIVPAGHGSGGVLVAEDGPALPMIDYEQPIPSDVDASYRGLAGSYAERGSPFMAASFHTARQMLWMETAEPDAFSRAVAFLGIPQYWAWRLCGVAASEVTVLAAQSHLWDVARATWAPIVRARGWKPLLPPLRPAWEVLGRLRPGLAARLGFDADVLCGIHDSTANFTRYREAGMAGFTVLSTGTWMVALSDAVGARAVREDRGMMLNADILGRPLPGALTMAGREFEAIAGGSPAPLDPAQITAQIPALVARGTMALPFFGVDDGLFPGRAQRGRIAGPPPEDAGARRALAALTMALLADALLSCYARTGPVVIDGPGAEPIFASLLAALRPGADIRSNPDQSGPQAGAALLVGHPRASVPVTLVAASPAAVPGLAEYAARWRADMTETFAVSPMA